MEHNEKWDPISELTPGPDLPVIPENEEQMEEPDILWTPESAFHIAPDLEELTIPQPIQKTLPEPVPEEVQEPVPETIPEPVPEEIQEPVPEEAQELVGESILEPPVQSLPVYEPMPERRFASEPARKGKKVRKIGMGRRILAAVLTVALVVGFCAATAGIVNRRWEDRTNDLQMQVDEAKAQISGLQAQIQDLIRNQSSNGTSGSPVAPQDSLTPSQVYAMNVNSVVAISNQSTTNIWGQVSETASSGTGFIISEDGYILTNYHVVEAAAKLTVITSMGREYEAKLVGFDKRNDVAVLKVDAIGLDAVTIGSSDNLIVGDQVVAIGNPLGELTSSLTVGYISAKDRTINTDGNLINMMQTDAAINPGNSGGPLFNMKGEVIGITTAKYSGSTTSGASIEGIGFAIPIADAMSMTQDLIEHGYLTNQAYLGVTVRDLDATAAAMYSLPMGSYVDSVVEGSCAEKAGIRPKDIIIGVGEYPVDGNATLQNVLRKFRAGDSTTITVFRAGAELKLDITFDERPQDPDAEIQQSQGQGEMPSSGSYEDWYDYFFPFFSGRDD